MRPILTLFRKRFFGLFQTYGQRAFWLASTIGLGVTQGCFSHLPFHQAMAGETSRLSLSGRASSCSVISVHDGDTMKLDCAQNEDNSKLAMIRLYCIDAPELGQKPWGKLARDHLRNLTGAAVAIEVVEHDKYGRAVARVVGNGEDLSLKMVSDGFAAVYVKYCRDKNFYDEESSARAMRSGIWGSDGAQQRPWEFRKNRLERRH